MGVRISLVEGIPDLPLYLDPILQVHSTVFVRDEGRSVRNNLVILGPIGEVRINMLVVFSLPVR